ncbi:MAG: zeta toxin family protein [Candidatus Caenarcaniphilales bacterium]|nr:zeta toxin family protein [Candidatus Caenarcaniphilales bacterium]
MPKLFIIGGPNGAGKTTAALKILPDYLNCLEYVNADSIAAGLSPFNPSSVDMQSGRLMLGRINELLEEGSDFAFESTLASRSFVGLIERAKAKKYKINLIYFWLDSPELAIQRVKIRVKKGGHNIPEEVVKRRYERSRSNFYNLYLPLSDNWTVYDNSTNLPILVAEGDLEEKLVLEKNIWSNIIEGFNQ